MDVGATSSARTNSSWEREREPERGRLKLLGERRSRGGQDHDADAKSGGGEGSEGRPAASTATHGYSNNRKDSLIAPTSKRRIIESRRRREERDKKSSRASRFTTPGPRGARAPSVSTRDPRPLRRCRQGPEVRNDFKIRKAYPTITPQDYSRACSAELSDYHHWEEDRGDDEASTPAAAISDPRRQHREVTPSPRVVEINLIGLSQFEILRKVEWLELDTRGPQDGANEIDKSPGIFRKGVAW